MTPDAKHMEVDPDANGWQPIETAPMDGTRVYLWCRTFCCDPHTGEVAKEEWMEPGCHWARVVSRPCWWTANGPLDSDAVPLLWHPEPKPPVEAA